MAKSSAKACCDRYTTMSSKAAVHEKIFIAKILWNVLEEKYSQREWDKCQPGTVLRGIHIWIY